MQLLGKKLQKLLHFVKSNEISLHIFFRGVFLLNTTKSEGKIKPFNFNLLHCQTTVKPSSGRYLRN